MKFYKVKDKMPKEGEIVLIKPKKIEFGVKYYVVEVKYDNYYRKDYWFMEAAGEPDSGWDKDEVEGWCPLTEIDKNIEWVKE